MFFSLHGHVCIRELLCGFLFLENSVREGGREGGARRVRTRRNASVYVGCGVGERGRQCDPSGGACRALHTGVGAAAGDAQDPGRCGFLSNKTITHQNFYNLAPFSWLLASLVGTFLCSSYIVA